MARYCLCTFLIFGFNIVSLQAGDTWAEKLGFPEDARVIILHADDIGMCQEANAAAIFNLEGSYLQSAAAMVPCPWFPAFAAWAKKNPAQDVGLHLTLTSEWKHYRWGPVSNPRDVPGLVDPDGFLWRDVRSVVAHATPEEVEREIRAQIQRARQFGIEPSHIDTHMGTLFGHPAYTEAYLKVAEEFNIPAMVIEMRPEVVEEFHRRGYPMPPETVDLINAYPLPKLDTFISLGKADSFEGKKQVLFETIRQLRPGLTEIIMHPSAYSEGLREITNSWQQRAWEADLFADAEVQAFFKQEGIVFTNWKEIMQRFDDPTR